MKLLGLLVLAVPLLAAVDGTVVNRTSSKPQPGVAVTLIRLGQGMQPAGSATTDAQGRFRMDQEVQPGTPYLLQAEYEGVTYNRMLPPGSPSTGLQVEVYEAKPEPGTAAVAQHMLLLEPSQDGLSVSESIIFENNGNATYYDPAKGTFRFYVPPQAGGQVRVSVQGPQGMPIERQPEQAGAPGTYKVDYPVRPGETRFDLSYALPLSSPPVFESKLMHGGPLRIVAPRGVTLRGENVNSLGTEPRTQATIYDVKGPDYRVEIEGTGTLRGTAEPSGEQDTGPPIEQKKPPIYRSLYLILGLTLAMLAIGLLMLYRNPGTRT
ncbi:MAG: carboxypeptidase-like regulatory domain-containing protein [Bryobacteraceae bacterium]